MRTIPRYLLLVTALSAPALADKNRDLIDAVQREDLAAVRALLADGADPNTLSPDRASLLHFAVLHRRADLTDLLLKRGTDPNVRDRTRQKAPIDYVMELELFDIAELLVRQGAAFQLPEVLLPAAEHGHLGLVEAVLIRARVSGRPLAEALVGAEAAGHDDVAARLRKAGAPAFPTPKHPVRPDRLKLYAGTYISREMGLPITIRPFGPALKGRVRGQLEYTFVPIAEHTFTCLDVPDYDLRFRLDRGRCVGIVVIQNERELRLYPIDDPPSRAQFGGIPDPSAVPDPPAERATHSNWPQFRGPDASGLNMEDRPPIHWDVRTGKNVLWSAAIPGLGHASPIVWGNRVFVYTAVPSKGRFAFAKESLGPTDLAEPTSAEVMWRLYCFDASTGAVVWQKDLFRALPNHARHKSSTFANSTPATDGRHVVVVVEGKGLFCLDFSGNVLWTKDLGDLETGWFYDSTFPLGFSSSPIIHDGRVVFQCDRNRDGFIAAYDVRDGREIWKTPRDEPPGFSTPIVVTVGDRTEIVANGGSFARAYDWETGKTTWRFLTKARLAAATPVFANDLIYISGGARPYKPLLAIRPGALGDISTPGDSPVGPNEHLAWSRFRNGSMIPTPIGCRGMFISLLADGTLKSIDQTDGRSNGLTTLGGIGTYAASPVIAHERMYFISIEGEVIVTRASRAFERMAVNFMHEPCFATPAIADNTLFIRSLHHVYAIGHPNAAR